MPENVVNSWDGVQNTDSWVHDDSPWVTDGVVERSAVDIVGLAEQARQDAEHASASATSAGASANAAANWAEAASGYAGSASVARTAASGYADNASAYADAIVSGGYVTSATVSDVVDAAISSGGYVTSAEVSDVVDDAISSGGYVTSSGASSITSAYVASGGYATSANVSSIISSGGYATSSWVTSQGYATSAYVSSATVASAGVATKVGTSTVGSSGNPVYISSGKPVSMSVVNSATNASSLGGVAASSYALDANVVKLTGDQTISGGKTFTDRVHARAYEASEYFALYRNVNNDRLIVYGGQDASNGAIMALFGKEHSSAGMFKLRAVGSATKDFDGKADGSLTWDGKGFVYDSGDQTISGTKTFAQALYIGDGSSIKKADSSKLLQFGFGTSLLNGARLNLMGKDSTSNAGCFDLKTGDGTTTKALIGYPSGSLKWDGQSIQTTSDERLKTPLNVVPDAVLDAWGDVGWGQFQYLEAVAEKGAGKARLHLGLIAQRIEAVFEARGLDACKYGILCHEEHPATEDEPEIDLWMVRYAEALAMEAAYQRRRADMAEARIAELERKMAAVMDAIGGMEG